MSNRAIQSHLQNSILLYLEGEDVVESLTELATALEVHRSSVSRSMKALKEAKLVERSEKTWYLTEEGKVEAQHTRLHLMERAKKTSSNVNRLLDQSRLSNTNALTTSKQNLAYIKQLDEQQKALDQTLGYNAKQIVSLFQATAERQNRLMSTWLQQEPIHKHIEHMNNYMQELYDGTAIRPLIDNKEVRSVLLKATKELKIPELITTSLDKQTYQLLNDTLAAARTHTSTLNAARLSGITNSLWGNSDLRSALYEAMDFYGRTPSLVEIMAKQVSNYDKNFADIFGQLGSRLLEEAAASLSTSQLLTTSLIERARSTMPNISPQVIDDLGQVSANITKALGDVGAMTSSIHSAYDRQTFGLLSSIAEIGRTYSGHHAKLMTQINTPEPYGVSPGLAVSTKTTTMATGTVRSIVIPPILDSSSTVDSYWFDNAVHLNNIFEGLGPQYSRMWHGSWDVLRSNSPDRVRQAAHSGRELLTQILSEWAPDNEFSQSDIDQYGNNGNITRKMRISFILTGESHSTIAWLDSIARAIIIIHDRFIGIGHNREDQPLANELQVAGLLLTIGGMIQFLHETLNYPNRDNTLL